MFKRLLGLPALSAWRGSALPHLGGVQHQAAITPAGPTPNQGLQAVGAHLAQSLQAVLLRGTEPRHKKRRRLSLLRGV